MAFTKLAGVDDKRQGLLVVDGSQALEWATMGEGSVRI